MGNRIEMLVQRWRASMRKQDRSEKSGYGSSPEEEALLGGQDFEVVEKESEQL